MVYASARRQDFPIVFARLMGHKSPTPVYGIIFESESKNSACSPSFAHYSSTTAIAGAILLVTGTYDTLITYFSVSAWIFYFVTGLVIFVMRYREPDIERPFRVWLFVPVLFCLTALGLVISTVYQQPVQSCITLGIMAAGVPVYLLKQRFGLFGPRYACCHRSEGEATDLSPDEEPMIQSYE